MKQGDEGDEGDFQEDMDIENLVISDKFFFKTGVEVEDLDSYIHKNNLE